MERFIYIDGVFVDSVSNTPQEIARSLGCKMLYEEKFIDPIYGLSERVYLTPIFEDVTKKLLERWAFI